MKYLKKKASEKYKAAHRLGAGRAVPYTSPLSTSSLGHALPSAHRCVPLPSSAPQHKHLRRTYQPLLPPGQAPASLRNPHSIGPHLCRVDQNRQPVLQVWQ